MADSEDTHSISFETLDVIKKIKELNYTFEENNNILGNTAKIMLKLSESGDVLSATLHAMDKHGQEFTQTYRELDGQLKTTEVSFKNFSQTFSENSVTIGAAQEKITRILREGNVEAQQLRQERRKADLDDLHQLEERLAREAIAYEEASLREARIRQAQQTEISNIIAAGRQNQITEAAERVKVEDDYINQVQAEYQKEAAVRRAQQSEIAQILERGRQTQAEEAAARRLIEDEYVGKVQTEYKQEAEIRRAQQAEITDVLVRGRVSQAEEAAQRIKDQDEYINQVQAEYKKEAAVRRAQQAEIAEIVRQGQDVATQTRQESLGNVLGGQAADQVRARLSEQIHFGQGTPEQIQRINVALDDLVEHIRAGNVDALRFGQIMQAVSRGSAENFVGAEREVVNSIINTRKEIGQLTTAGSDLGRVAKNTGDRIIITWQNIVRFVQFRLLYAGLYNLIGAMKASIQEAEQFGLRVAEIRTIAQDSALSFDDWRKSVVELSNEFGKPTTEVAAGLYETLSNQVARGAEATNFMREAMKFAAVTASSTADAVNLLSSAINSYGLKANDAERISAIFFKVIDLGRVRASEMGNTFGRVAGLAQTLGVNIEETGAAIATLTINGIKYNEAYTLINNLLLKLIKPTKDMQVLFRQWGVETGETAIKTFGFVGTLRKLEDATHGSSSETAQLFRDIRAIRGALGLTGSALEGYEKTLNRIKTESLPSYRKATEESLTTPYFQFQKQLQEVKNYFINGFGDPFIRTTLNIAKVLGGDTGLVGAINTLARALYIATPAWLGYRAAILTTDAAAVGFGRTMELLRTKLLTNPVALAVAAIAALSAYAYLATRDQAEELANTYKTTYDRVQKDAEKLLNEQKELLDQETQAVINGINTQFQYRLQNIARVRAVLETMLEDQKAVVARQKDVIKLTFDSQLGALKDALDELEKRYRTTISNIQEAQRLLAELRDKREDRGFQIKLEFAKPEERSQIIAQRVADLRKEMASLLTGQQAPDQLQENLKRYKERANEIATLLKDQAREHYNIENKRKDLVEKIAELERRTAAEKLVAAGRDQVSTDQKATYEARLAASKRGQKQPDIVDLEGKRRTDSAQLTGLRTGEAERRAAQELADTKTKLAELDKENQLLPDRVQLQKLLGDLDKEQYATLQKVTAELQKQADATKAQADNQKAHNDALRQAFEEILKFKLPDNIANQQDKSAALGGFDALLKKAEATGGLTNQQTIFELQKYRIELSKQADLEIQKHTLQTQAETVEQIQKKLIEQRETLKNAQLDNTKSLNAAVSSITAIGEELSKAQDAFHIRGAVGQQVEDFRTSVDALNENPTDKNVQQQTIDSLEALRKAITDNTLHFENDPAGAKQLGNLRISDSRNLINVLQDFYNAIQVITKDTATDEELKKTGAKLTQTEKGLGIKPEEIKAALGATTDELRKYGADFRNEIQKTSDTFRRFQVELQGTSDYLKALRPSIPATPKVGAPAGGPVSFAQPNYNVGEINVTVQSTGNANLDGKQIAVALNQELRRGTVGLYNT